MSNRTFMVLSYPAARLHATAWPIDRLRWHFAIGKLPFMRIIPSAVVCLIAAATATFAAAPAQNAPLAQHTPATAPAPSGTPAVDATTLHHKIMAGYQGWFRCPGDGANVGWRHWSRDSKQITPASLTFEMWPQMSEYTPAERFAAPAFTYPDGSQAELFSSDNAATVLRHFQWMRDYGIDGAWLQEFLVDLPGGPGASLYPTRLRVLHHVMQAATQTGRTWAITYDVSGLAADRILPVLSAHWKSLVDEKVTDDPRYLHEGGKPVVQVWGFYYHNRQNGMTPEQAGAIVDFFKMPGKYSAFVAGGGAWDWRRAQDPKWKALYRRLDAYAPWNTGNISTDSAGVKHAATSYWADDKQVLERSGGMWIPVIYPGFSWDNLRQKPAGSTLIARRGGNFLWEQFVAAARLKPESIFIAMFDEVDEGTAIFKITNTPPTQAHFVDNEGLPSDWYLRLAGEGAKMWRGEKPLSEEIPIHPADRAPAEHK